MIIDKRVFKRTEVVDPEGLYVPVPVPVVVYGIYPPRKNDCTYCAIVLPRGEWRRLTLIDCDSIPAN